MACLPNGRAELKLWRKSTARKYFYLNPYRKIKATKLSKIHKTFILSVYVASGIDRRTTNWASLKKLQYY